MDYTDQLVFTFNPSQAMIDNCEAEGKLCIALVRAKDYPGREAYLSQYGITSSYWYIYMLADATDIEEEKKKIIEGFNKMDYTPWYAPAGITRGKLTLSDVKGVVYGDVITCDDGIVIESEAIPLDEPILDTAQQVLDHIDTEVKKACDNMVFDQEPKAVQEAIKVWGDKIISNPRTMNKINMRRIIMMKPEVTQSGKQFIIKYMHNTYIIKHQRKRVRVKRAANFYKLLLNHWGLIARKCLGSEIEFKVICDETNNSPEDCKDGKMNVTICITNKVRPKEPAPCPICNGYGGVINEAAGLDGEGQPFWETCECQRDYDAEDRAFDLAMRGQH